MFDDLTTMMTVSGHSQDLGYLQIDQLLLPILEAYQQQIEQQHRELIVDVEKAFLASYKMEWLLKESYQIFR